MAVHGDPYTSFTGAFEGEITFHWEPNPQVISMAIMEVAEALEDMAKPLLAARAVSQADMRNRFETDTDPDGNAWAPLDPDYERYKTLNGGPAGDILTWTEELEREASAPNAFLIDGDSLFWDGSGIPDYGWYHEHGSGAGNAGAHLDYRERYRAGVLEGDSGGSHASLGIGRGNALPRRNFVGVSEEAQFKIIEIFDLWFDESASIFIGKGGMVQERGPGGRFGKRLF